MLNNVVLVGRLTKNPELHETKSGKPVINISIAFDSANGEDSCFIDGVAFEKTAEAISKFCNKGDLIGITGRLNQRKFERKDGSKGSTIEVLVSSVEFMQPKKEEAPTPNPDEFAHEEEEVAIPKGYHKDENGNLIKDKAKK